MRRVAIIGGGAAGMGAGYRLLRAGCDVTLFEARDHVGGSCYGVDVPLRGGGSTRVDGGVSDFDRVTSPTLVALLDQLGMRTRPVRDDASAMDQHGESLWSDRREPADFRWPVERRRFERHAQEAARSPFYDTLPTERYLDSRGYSTEFRRCYLYPKSAACLAMTEEDTGAYPIRDLVRLWNDHGLMDRSAPQRRTVDGGLHRMGEAFARWFQGSGGSLLLARRVVNVSREDDEVGLDAMGADGREAFFRFDAVVFATVPGRSIALLDDAAAAERLLAAGFKSRPVRRITHLDRRLMPRDAAGWGTHNFLVCGDAAAPPHHPTMTTHLNRLANLGADVPDVFVTLNPHVMPAPEHVLDDRWLTQPEAGPAARETAQLADHLQGRRNTWFCGAYLRAPFLPEQAVASAFDVADRILDRQSALRSERPAPIRAVA